jgi:hypothetical protein
MPSKEAHVVAAIENQRVIDYLCERIDDHPGWVVTVAFYKALHLVEAAFAGESAGSAHTDDHKTRNATLKKTKRYSHIWKYYQPLWVASLIARYLRENEQAPTYDVFSGYMPSSVVRDKALGHYLRQIEKSVGDLLGDPDYLTGQPTA